MSPARTSSLPVWEYGSTPRCEASFKDSGPRCSAPQAPLVLLSETTCHSFPHHIIVIVLVTRYASTMQHLLLFAGLAAPGSAVKFHAPLNSLVQVGEGFVRFNVTGHPHIGSPSGAHKRDSEVELTPQQAGTAYTIQLSLGTPGQAVVVQLDTGSSDLWVNPNCSNNNGADQISYCNSFPRFDSSQSSTLVNADTSFNLAYGLGTATVQYVQDTVQAGSKQHDIPHARLLARAGSRRRSNAAC